MVQLNKKSEKIHYKKVLQDWLPGKNRNQQVITDAFTSREQFYKIITSVIYKCSLYARMFDPGKSFQPSLMFASKAEYLIKVSKWLFIYNTLAFRFKLIINHCRRSSACNTSAVHVQYLYVNTVISIDKSDKRASLSPFFTYRCKKLYIICHYTSNLLINQV